MNSTLPFIHDGHLSMIGLKMVHTKKMTS